MSDRPEITAAVRQLYNTYPFPPEPLLDEPPPGYNWRWHWSALSAFCTGKKPDRADIRVLDAGCGTGVGTEYIAHLNPEAKVTAIDLSEKALEVAKERTRRSGANTVEFHSLSLYDVGNLSGEFDWINCVGVLHHLPDPVLGLRSLAEKLAPGGIIHIFVYAELGRWEVRLMQAAIALLQGEKRGDFEDGVKLGRQLFSSLPEDNRIVKEDKRRWSLENHRDANFADMYLHPQEIDYNIKTLFELVDASGLEFVGFTNPDYWQLERLFGDNVELMSRAKTLEDRDRFRLIELLDPELSHYEFCLAKPPFSRQDWSDDRALEAAVPELNPCTHGWPSKTLFDYNYCPVSLSDGEFAFLQQCDGTRTVGEILSSVELGLDEVRSLQSRQLILLAN